MPYQGKLIRAPMTKIIGNSLIGIGENIWLKCLLLLGLGGI